MTRFPCDCEIPRPYPTPHKAHTCVRCLGEIKPEWKSTDKNLAAFFGRLEEAAPDTTLWLNEFRGHCEQREHAGRESFGYEYLRRDNPTEATEEACDGAIYMYLDGLRCLREGKEEDADVRLTAAFHFAKAHYYSRMLLAKRRGNPGPGMED